MIHPVVRNVLCKRYEKRELFSHLSFGLSWVHLMTVFLLHHVQNTTISNSSVMYLNQAIFFTFIINFCKYETPKSNFF